MANPLKVLTQLTASREAQFAEVVEMQKTVTVSGGDLKYTNAAGEISGSGAFKNAGAAQLGSTLAVAGDANLASKLDVKGNSALSGTLGVVGAAALQSTLSVASDADLNGTLDVQGDANFQADIDIAGYMKAVGEISGSAALNIGGAAHIAGAAQLDSTLSVDGNADFDGTLAVVGNISTQASASVEGDLDVNGLADIAGNLDVHGNAVIYGNLEVKGVTTTIESTTVTVADANIQLATVASPTDTTADGAGITILGATNKTFQWNNDGHGFTSSEDVNLAAGKVYKIDGQELLAKDGSSAKLSYNGGSASISISSAAVSMAGDLDIVDNLHVSGNMEVDGASQFDGVASFASDITASAGMDVAGAVNLQNTLAVGGVASFASDITASANVDVAGHMNLASGKYYKINGKEVVAEHGGGMMFAADAAAGTAFVQVTDNNKVYAFANAETDDAINLNASNGGAEIAAGTRIKLQAPFIDVQGDLSGSAGLDLVGAAHIAGAADFDSTLNVDGVASFASDITASAGMDLAGDINLHNGSEYKINGIRVLEAFDNGLDGEGNPDFITVLKGQKLDPVSGYADARVILAQTAATLYGKDYVYVQSNDIAIQADERVWIRSHTTGTLQELRLEGLIGVTGSANFADAVDLDSTLNVDGQADFQAASNFHANVGMDAALELSGTTFQHISTPIVNDKYNVNDAIRALDAMVGTQGNNVNSNYNALRYLDSDFFDAQGMASFTSSFAIADIEQVSVDVLVQAGGSGPWTNDLLSVQVKAAGSYVGFEISAPAMGASDKVRIIAVKESGSLA